MLSKVNVVSPHFSLFLSNFTLNPTVQAVKFLPQKPQYVEKNLKSKIEELKEVLLSLVLRGSFRLKVPSSLKSHAVPSLCSNNCCNIKAKNETCVGSNKVPIVNVSKSVCALDLNIPLLYFPILRKYINTPLVIIIIISFPAGNKLSSHWSQQLFKWPLNRVKVYRRASLTAPAKTTLIATHVS